MTLTGVITSDMPTVFTSDVINFVTPDPNAAVNLTTVAATDPVLQAVQDKAEALKVRAEGFSKELSDDLGQMIEDIKALRADLTGNTLTNAQLALRTTSLFAQFSAIHVKIGAYEQILEQKSTDLKHQAASFNNVYDNPKMDAVAQGKDAVVAYRAENAPAQQTIKDMLRDVDAIQASFNTLDVDQSGTAGFLVPVHNRALEGKSKKKPSDGARLCAESQLAPIQTKLEMDTERLKPDQ